ncbi:WYL domain-containing protein [Aliiglaciecola sp. LCG003]|uniref:WYL domain-containing protein n=1 Tax=Aliiglaciecola sp. LCG003 TaxID=3053655 RepID=UPI00257271A8|nr:WYL domain-containing protein [Aliiglaciecola sp. LCG003]WJG10667.1 WYL domain-containing protein [Aliiglaciecola sp. LCG003]
MKEVVRVGVDEMDIHYQLIELLAYWQGAVNTTHIVNHFKISRQQAQKYFTEYQQNNPNNLVYDKSAKSFLPTNNFQSKAIDEDVNQYLEWLSNSSNMLSAQIQPSPHLNSITYTSLELPKRSVSCTVMRGLVAAIKQQKRVDVDYVSLANPDGEGRIIQPHIFVRTGLRWHLRAFDEKHKEFRDFVLSRFRGEPELLDKGTHCAKQDSGWNTYINIILAPDQRLNMNQKRVIEHDYQMQNGQLVIKTRAALAQYLLQEMQINIKFHDAYPEAQQLVLLNKNDIKDWLFNS